MRYTYGFLIVIVLILCKVDIYNGFRGNSLEKLVRRRSDLLMNAVDTRPREFRNLKPIPCPGTYNPTSYEKLSSYYLGPEKMIIQERDDGKCITKGLVPIAVPDDIENALVAAGMVKQREQNMYKSWSGSVVTERNGGFYDFLKSTFLWAGKPNARREIYNALRLKGSCLSPYHGVADAMQTHAGLKVCGLLLELADSSQFTVALGAAVLVARTDSRKNWRLTYTNTRAINAVRGSQEAQLVKCTLDELVGLGLATQLPIVVSSSLYETIAIDGLLAQDPDSLKMQMTAPYFSSEQEAKLWRQEQRRMEEQSKENKVRSAKQVPRPRDIPDATTFLHLKTSEKRAILRATGLPELPRPREGPRAVDALLIPLLDEEVAYEVLRRLAETKGDFSAAAQMVDFQSRKPEIARAIRIAKQEGDSEKARLLCEELNALSTLRFDPTNPDQLSGEWDVEEWYWEQRKIVYGIIAA